MAERKDVTGRLRDYKDLLSEAEDDRSDWIADWQDVTNYIMPHGGLYIDKGQKQTDGGRKNQYIKDPEATFALRTMAAGLKAGLTSPAHPWFKLGVVDEDLGKEYRVRTWLNEAEKAIYAALARSNFYTTIHRTYEELGAFGTALQYCEDDGRGGVWFRAFTAGTYSLAIGVKGVVDQVFRRFYMTARQIITRFGEERVSDAVKRAMDNNTPNELIQVCHIVRPRYDADPADWSARGMAWESVYFEYDETERFLLESGYAEMPFQAPRWDVKDEDTYGMSPCMHILGQTMMLQSVAVSQTRAIQKVADPPLKAPPSFMTKKISAAPGSINYVNQAEREALGSLYDIQPDIGAITGKIEDIRNQIRRGLFVDLFLMIANADISMTATEVVERHEEKLLMLGPVIERQTTELLDPTIDRVFAVLLRNGKIPPPPEIIQGRELKVEYVSMLAQAQKLVGTRSINAITGYIAGVAKMLPEALDRLDVDEAIDEYADMTGVPPKVIRSRANAVKIRQARAQAAARQRATEEQAAAVANAKALSETQVGGQNALEGLMETMRGGAL